MNIRRFVSLAASLTILVQSAIAGEVRMYQDEDLPDPREVAVILNPTYAPQATRVRSLRLLSEVSAAQTRSVSVNNAIPAPEVFSSFALGVKFSSNSTHMLPESTAQLDAVAEGIKLAGPDVRVVIEGHTDAFGASDYNMFLSLKRASAVKAYLVQKHGIASNQLAVVGMGDSTPLNKRNRYAPENRRVEFRAEIG